MRSYNVRKKYERFLGAFHKYTRAYHVVFNKKLPFGYNYVDGWVRVYATVNEDEIEVDKMRIAEFEEMADKLDARVPTKERKAIIEARLIKAIGDEAYNALKEGRATFQVWRRTSPWNQWVEDENGDMLWHSSDGNRIGMTHFSNIKDSKEVIRMSLIPGEIGKPDHSHYKLKLNLKYY